MKPKIIILRTAGTNCDYETQSAFELAGGIAKRVHINSIIAGDERLEDYQILALPGGFSYGDDIASGKILANEIRYKLRDGINNFVESGKPVIGICNGFQVLVKMGLLPDTNFIQTTTLTFNTSDKFECRWVHLNLAQRNGFKSLWIKDVPDSISLPIAHGEGRFITVTDKKLNEIEKNGQVVFRYQDNPNGSINDIAGICNKKGNVFGLMPHPERFVYKWQHFDRSYDGEHGYGYYIFKNAVDFVKK